MEQNSNKWLIQHIALELSTKDAFSFTYISHAKYVHFSRLEAHHASILGSFTRVDVFFPIFA